MEIPVRAGYCSGMAIPVDTHAEATWRALSADQKRARILETANTLFAESGIEVPMPDLAAAVGIGVGSLYRQFATKDDLIAELVLQRATALQEQWTRATEQDDAWAALQEVVIATVSHKLTDRVARETWTIGMQREDVAQATAEILATMERLVDAARKQGALRADVTAADLRLLFRGAREAESLQPGGATRLAELTLAGLRAVPH